MSSAKRKNPMRRSMIDRDVSIENASSFEEARAIIETRLKNLRSDLTCRTPEEDTIIAEICKAQDDRKVNLMDLYTRFFSPCKVIDPEFDPKGQGDMTDVMINFSEGFDEFIESLEEQYVNLIIKRRRATLLLNRMLSIKLPYSRLMYLYYFKAVEPKDIAEQFFISRATFYRLKSSAINAITEMYYQPKNKKRKHNHAKLPDDQTSYFQETML